MFATNKPPLCLQPLMTKPSRWHIVILNMRNPMSHCFSPLETAHAFSIIQTYVAVIKAPEWRFDTTSSRSRNVSLPVGLPMRIQTVSSTLSSSCCLLQELGLWLFIAWKDEISAINIWLFWLKLCNQHDLRVRINSQRTF